MLTIFVSHLYCIWILDVVRAFSLNHYLRSMGLICLRKNMVALEEALYVSYINAFENYISVAGFLFALHNPAFFRKII